MNQSIASSPDEVAYYVRGNIYESKGELEKAIDDYTRADRIHPDQQHVFENRADVYERLGRTEEAQKDRAHAEWLGSPTNAFNQARAFMDRLNDEGVYIRLSPSGDRVIFKGAPMKREDVPMYEQLKSDLLQILRDDLL